MPNGLPMEFDEDAFFPIQDLSDSSPCPITDAIYTYASTNIDRLSQALGIPWEPTKTVEFAFLVQYLGFVWDPQEQTVAVPLAKKEKYLQAIREWNDRSMHTLEEDERTSPDWKPCWGHSMVIYSVHTMHPQAPMMTSNGGHTRSPNQLSITEYQALTYSSIIRHTQTPAQVSELALPLATAGERGDLSQVGTMMAEILVGPKQWALSSSSEPSSLAAKKEMSLRFSATTEVLSKAGGRVGAVTSPQTLSSNTSTVYLQTMAALYTHAMSPASSIQQMNLQEESIMPTASCSQLSRSPLSSSPSLLTSTNHRTHMNALTANMITSLPHFQSQLLTTPLIRSDSVLNTTLTVLERPSCRAQQTGRGGQLVWVRYAQLPSTTHRGAPTAYHPSLAPRPSMLHPHCFAGERLRLWKPVSSLTPRGTISQNDIDRVIATMALGYTEGTMESYGSGLLAWHVWCDSKDIPDEEHAPASQILISTFISTMSGTFSGKTTVKLLSSSNLTVESGLLGPTLCRWLCDHSSSYAACLAEALEKDSELAHGNSKIQLKQMLIQPWEASAPERVGLPPLIIVVDALDENQSGSEFLQHLLQAVAATELRGLKFFVTSREDEQISRLCTTLPQGTVLHLQDIQKQIAQNDIGLYLTQSLPGIHSNASYQELLEKLKEHSDGLFIYAATVVKMVTANDAAVTEQMNLLQGIIDWSESPQLGDLYCQIVKDAVGLQRSNVQASRLQVLHTILCAMHPISETVVAQLAKTTLDVVATVLKKLHAVMYKAHDGMIYTYHASFADYILQTPIVSETAFELHCNVGLQHAFLAQRSYDLMKKQLCFNICGLESSFVKDADVQDLQKHIQDKIDRSLNYAVLTWMAHLNSATDPDKALLNVPQLFVEKLLLYWMEVVNLLNARREGMQMLVMLRSWISRYTPNTLGLWEEACKFYQFFVSGSASAYTPHLYISALSCWNPKSGIVKIWQPQFPFIPKITATYMSGHLMTIQTSSPIYDIGISPDGKQVVSGSYDHSVCIWDTLTGELVKELKGHTNAVWSVAFSPDGTHVVSGSYDQLVRIWDALTKDLVKELVWKSLADS
ncbi:hypothetical protein DXG01_002920, partial [Tephrocybe rancida]